MPGLHRREFSRLVEGLLSCRKFILVSTLLLVCFSLLGLTKLGFSLDNRAYFDPSNSERLKLEAVERDHGRYTNAVLVVKPRSGTVLTKSSVSALRDAKRLLSSISNIVWVDSILTQPARLPNGPALIEDGDIIDEAAIEKIRVVIGQRRASLTPLVSNDNTAAAVSALIRVDAEKPDLQLKTAQDIQSVRLQLAKAYPNVDVYLTGDAILEATFIEAILRDLVSLVPFQVGATIVFLLFALQSVTMTVGLLLILVATIGVTMGFAGFFGLALNGVTSATPVILMGLSIATGIHIIFSWQHARHEGLEVRAAIERSLELNAFPVTLATATTVVSFLCMNFSDSPPFRELGNLVAFGLVVTWVLGFTVLPSLISYFPNAIGKSRDGLEKSTSKLSSSIITHRALIVAIFAFAVVLSLFGISRLQFDDRFSHYFDESYDFRISTDFYEENLSGLSVLRFSHPAAMGETVWSYSFISNIDRFQEWLRDQPEVTAVSNLSNLVHKAAFAIPGHPPGVLPKPGLFFDKILGHLRSQLTESAVPTLLVAQDQTKSLTTVTLRGVSSSDIRAFAKAAESWLEREMPDHFVPAAGMPLISAHMAQRNANAMVLGTFAVLLIVSAMMFFILDSFKLGLLSLVPNLVPMVLAFGFWGLAFGQASFAVTVVSAITFGLVVDGTIHILSRYRYSRVTLDLSVPNAIQYSLSTVGIAVLATSLAVASGFATLAFSGFLVNHELGLLCSIVLISALLADLLFLPALISLFDRDHIS